MTDSISDSETELDFIFYRDYLYRQVDYHYDFSNFWDDLKWPSDLNVALRSDGELELKIYSPTQRPK